MTKQFRSKIIKKGRQKPSCPEKIYYKWFSPLENIDSKQTNLHHPPGFPPSRFLIQEKYKNKMVQCQILEQKNFIFSRFVANQLYLQFAKICHYTKAGIA